MTQSLAPEHLAHLTELARRIWPDAPHLRIDIYPFPDGTHEATVMYDPPDPDASAVLLSGSIHARSVDALEAALLVFAHGKQTVVQALARLHVPLLPINPTAEQEVNQLMQNAMQKPNKKEGTGGTRA
jgi:hypothetical protein